MKALAIAKPGAKATLLDLPTPVPSEGEVLVRVRASSINGFDLAVANGYLQGAMEHRFPVVLGKDFAGAVEAIGPGVDGFRAGDEVFGVVMKPYLGDGGLANYVAAPVAFVAKLPVGVEPRTAGALGLAGTAAADAVQAIAPLSGETVLVSGATGGVGAIAVQLIKARGATVIATAATDDKRGLVTGLGADATVDYRGDMAPAVKDLAADGVDAALHLAGDGAAIAALVRRGGRLASVLGLSAEQASRADLSFTAVMANPVTLTLARLAAAVAGGTLRVPVQRAYLLADAPTALSDYAAGTLGKLAITVG